MASVVVFHHAQGLTQGVLDFADRLRAAGHEVHTPDVYDGHTFATLEEGLAYAGEIGFENAADRGAEAAAALPAGSVYVGLSLGVMPAQKLAQTRAGALGVVLAGSCVPPEYFGGWPDGLTGQVHGMDADPVFVGEGDLDAARELAAAAPGVEVFLYPGATHLFMDSSLPDHDPEAAAQFEARVVEYLANVG